VEWIIRPAVFELFLESPTYLYAIFGSDRYIASVKETMEIAPQKQTVAHGMRTVLVERLDVGRFEGRQRMLLSNCAGPLIGIGDQDPKCALTKSWRNDGFFTITLSFFLEPLRLMIKINGILFFPSPMQILPNKLAGFLIKLVALGLPTDNGSSPIRGGKPHRFIEEECLSQDNAPNLKVLMGIINNSSVVKKPASHFRIGCRSVSLLEGFPSQADRKSRKRSENTAANNQIAIVCPGAPMELKEKKIPLFKSSKLGFWRRLPEIDLIDSWKSTQEIKPIMIRDADIESHQAVVPPFP